MTQVFICNRDGIKPVKIQLELSEEILAAYKKKAVGTQWTPKQLMENALRLWVTNEI